MPRVGCNTASWQKGMGTGGGERGSPTGGCGKAPESAGDCVVSDAGGRPGASNPAPRPPTHSVGGSAALSFWVGSGASAPGAQSPQGCLHLWLPAGIRSLLGPLPGAVRRQSHALCHLNGLAFVPKRCQVSVADARAPALLVPTPPPVPVQEERVAVGGKESGAQNTGGRPRGAAPALAPPLCLLTCGLEIDPTEQAQNRTPARLCGTLGAGEVGREQSAGRQTRSVRLGVRSHTDNPRRPPWSVVSVGPLCGADALGAPRSSPQHCPWGPGGTCWPQVTKQPLANGCCWSPFPWGTLGA